MSKTEDIFENFLISHNIQHVKSYKIFDIPFNNKGIHLVDFYLPEKDLYVEIKGFMTLYQINVLKYLLSFTNKHFYILQMTEEDWIIPYNKDEHLSVNRKIQNNIEIQFNEILNLKNDSLSQLSKNRLDQYIRYRSDDLDKWIKNKDAK